MTTLKISREPLKWISDSWIGLVLPEHHLFVYRGVSTPVSYDYKREGELTAHGNHGTTRIYSSSNSNSPSVRFEGACYAYPVYRYPKDWSHTKAIRLLYTSWQTWDLIGFVACNAFAATFYREDMSDKLADSVIDAMSGAAPKKKSISYAAHPYPYVGLGVLDGTYITASCRKNHKITRAGDHTELLGYASYKVNSEGVFVTGQATFGIMRDGVRWSHHDLNYSDYAELVLHKFENLPDTPFRVVDYDASFDNYPMINVEPITDEFKVITS